MSCTVDNTNKISQKARAAPDSTSKATAQSKKRKEEKKSNGGTAEVSTAHPLQKNLADIVQQNVQAPSAPTSMRITRNMKTDGPRQAVFNTAELLEAILLQIPTKQLFTIRRVSKQFRDTVDSSVKLQEEMFLRPRKAEKEVWTLRTFKPHLPNEWMQNQRCEFVQSSDVVSNTVQGADAMQPALLNPSINHARFVNSSESAALRIMRRRVEEFSLDLTACLRHPGTWQDMQLTEPPCTGIVLCPRLELNTRPPTHVYLGNHEALTKVSHPSGVTVGHLAQEVTRAILPYLVVRRSAGFLLKDTSIDELMSEARQTKPKGLLVGEFVVTAELADMVFPTKSEREEVRRK